jgi:hypothetical protein
MVSAFLSSLATNGIETNKAKEREKESAFRGFIHSLDKAM